MTERKILVSINWFAREKPINCVLRYNTVKFCQRKDNLSIYFCLTCLNCTSVGLHVYENFSRRNADEFRVDYLPRKLVRYLNDVCDRVRIFLVE